MIIVESYIDKIWGKNYLTKQEMKKIIKVCLKNTNHHEKNIFLNVSFVNSEQIKKYNLQFRGKNSITNVLSFENDDKFSIKNTIKLGEIVLCYEKIVQEAIEFNKTFRERLYHLFVHGILHLLGYDHINEEDRKKMEKLEEDILKHFRVFNAYDLL